MKKRNWRLMLRRVLNLVFSRLVITVTLVLLQVFWLFSVFHWLDAYSTWLNGVGLALSVIMCLALIRQDSTAPVKTDCLVQPFADSPVDREAVAKNVYLELINQAQRRLYICTPYLILDNDLLTCLRLAAKRGVDVRIYTPGVPDKPTIYQLTRSYFPHLLRAGVKIYSYTPGFLHAKTWLVDDRIAAVGTVNLDYRSLYLHFENSVRIYGGAVLEDVRKDLAEIERESKEVTLGDCRTGFVGTMYSAVLRLVAPLC